MPVKPEKQVIVDYIIVCLKKAEKREVILPKAVKKFKISRTTFDRSMTIAKKQHSEAQQVIKKAKADLELKTSLKKHKKLIADVTERQQFLTKVMRGQVKVEKHFVVDGKVKSVKVDPDVSDRKAAIAELNKMDGDYAEVAYRIKGDKDAPLFQPIGMVTDEQFQQLLNKAGETQTNTG